MMTNHDKRMLHNNFDETKSCYHNYGDDLETALKLILREAGQDV